MYSLKEIDFSTSYGKIRMKNNPILFRKEGEK